MTRPGNMGEKTAINSVEAVRKFPAFPVVLAAVGNGESNVITIGLVHVFSFSPTIIGVGISPSRYSHELFHKSQDFSVNIPGKELVEEVIFCGVSSGRDVDKFLDAGFHTHPGKRIKSPVIEDCMVIMECVKTETIDVGDHTWFLGEVVSAEIDSDYDRERLLMYWSGDFMTTGEVIRKR